MGRLLGLGCKSVYWMTVWLLDCEWLNAIESFRNLKTFETVFHSKHIGTSEKKTLILENLKKSGKSLRIQQENHSATNKHIHTHDTRHKKTYRSLITELRTRMRFKEASTSPVTRFSCSETFTWSNSIENGSTMRGICSKEAKWNLSRTCARMVCGPSVRKAIVDEFVDHDERITWSRTILRTSSLVWPLDNSKRRREW